WARNVQDFGASTPSRLHNLQLCFSLVKQQHISLTRFTTVHSFLFFLLSREVGGSRKVTHLGSRRMETF
ncbi:hypothetical protein MKX01_006576, partial [Papaver californicum]